MERDTRIYIAGHKGLVGSAILRMLRQQGYSNIISASHKDLDLRDKKRTEDFFNAQKPEYVFDAAARVGGIKANIERPAEFIYDNLQIQSNLINSAYQSGVKKFLFIASNCIYPINAKQPLEETSLMTGQPEPTNESFAVAKITGIKLGQAYKKQYGFNFCTLIPCSLFGPNDNFDPKNSHLVPALIRKFHDAKINRLDSVMLWGNEETRREIMHSDDASSAALFVMRNYESIEPINAGTNEEMSISDIALLVKDVIGYEGKIKYECGKPSGASRKIISSDKIYSLGWRPSISLREGIEKTYKWFLENKVN